MRFILRIFLPIRAVAILILCPRRMRASMFAMFAAHAQHEGLRDEALKMKRIGDLIFDSTLKNSPIVFVEHSIVTTTMSESVQIGEAKENP